MKYLLDKDNNYQCIYEADVTSIPTMTSLVSKSVDGTNDTITSEIITLFNYFLVYSSPYSGAFDLLDT